MYICHAGPSGHAHDDGSLSYEDFSMDRPAPSPLPDDGACYDFERFSVS